MIEGLDHNAEFQMDVLEDEEFRNGTYTTNLMEKRGWV